MRYLCMGGTSFFRVCSTHASLYSEKVATIKSNTGEHTPFVWNIIHYLLKWKILFAICTSKIYRGSASYQNAFSNYKCLYQITNDHSGFVYYTSNPHKFHPQMCMQIGNSQTIPSTYGTYGHAFVQPIAAILNRWFIDCLRNPRVEPGGSACNHMRSKTIHSDGCYFRIRTQ